MNPQGSPSIFRRSPNPKAFGFRFARLTTVLFAFFASWGPWLCQAAKHADELKPEELANGAITVDAASIVPSHKFATFLLDFIDGGLNSIGLRHDRNLEEFIYIGVVVVVAWLIGLIFEWIVKFIMAHLLKIHERHPEMEDLEKLLRRALKRSCRIIPPIVFLCLVPFAFVSDHHLLHWILRIAVVYTLFCVGLGATTWLEFGWLRFEMRDNQDHHPLKGVLNICRGLVWIIIFIISVSVLVDRSPMALLAGLGAFAAALMLIFKDSILGFVAGIQLSQNDMIRVGDWIVVPNTLANGSVIDVTLSVVKVQNWDNTIIMLPPYSLVQGSFQNYRNIYKVGIRLISQSVYVDHSSVRTATPELLKDLSARFPKLAKFIDERRDSAREGDPHVYNDQTKPNGTIDTNLGLFRAYCCQYLLDHPKVSEDPYLLVQIQPATNYGINLNFYFYSRITEWVPFEALQSEIFEHVNVMAPIFGLRLYNAPNGNTFTLNTPPAPSTSPTPASGS